jgi:allantoinase
MAIRVACECAIEAGCSLHVVHVSHPSGVDALELARQRNGSHLTCETCPHYLLLSDNDLLQIGAPAKCAPPLRSIEAVEQLRVVLRRGGFEFVASDHSPAPMSMKSGANAFDVWGGIAGVQSTLAILLSLDPSLEPKTVGLMTATNAARRFSIPNKGRITPGFDADLSLVDLDRTFVLRRDDLLDRHKLSPYVGRMFRGMVRRTILRGRTIFADGKMVGAPQGRFVPPGGRDFASPSGSKPDAPMT